MKYTIAALLSIGILCSCSKEKKKTGQQNDREATSKQFIADSNYVIIDYDPMEHEYIFEQGITTTLSLDELIEIETILDRAVKKHNQEVESYYQVSTDGYKRQYLAIMNKLGEKVIWINFTCGSWYEEADKGMIYVIADGGNCHYNLMINLNQGSYFDFYVNGYA